MKRGDILEFLDGFEFFIIGKGFEAMNVFVVSLAENWVEKF